MLHDCVTESGNPTSTNIDSLTPLGIVQLINSEDAKIAAAVAKEEQFIAEAIEIVTHAIAAGGRLIYIGAGTSGRLGVLDASECPPTFNTDPKQVIGLIAGGPAALTRAIEGAEDQPESAIEDLRGIGLTNQDCLVGIATSGRTPYVLSAVRFANQLGAKTIGFACNPQSELAELVDVMITPVVGPEVISGSTRMKAGTATKLVLNMLTTGAMVRLGKTYGNCMVDLRATNSKLVDRSRRLVARLTGLSEAESAVLLARCNGEVKIAIAMVLCNFSVDEARQRLRDAKGHLRQVIAANKKPQPQIQYMIGVDGGGTKTEAVLGTVAAAGASSGVPVRVIASFCSGSSNLQQLPIEAAFEQVEVAVEGLFAQVPEARSRVAAICFAVAGSGNAQRRNEFEKWLRKKDWSEQVQITHDARIVLAAGSENESGIAVIAGTGSIAYGRTVDGREARCGGWRELISDEGSAYWVAAEGFRRALHAVDRRGPTTCLVDELGDWLGQTPPSEWPHRLAQMPRQEIAKAANVIAAAAEKQDEVAERILDDAAAELATMIETLASQLFPNVGLHLAFAGGMLCGCRLLQNKLEAAIKKRGLQINEIQYVTSPVVGALRIATRRASCSDVSEKSTTK